MESSFNERLSRTSLSPPVSLVKGTKSNVMIISTKKPVVVYFKKALMALQQNIIEGFEKQVERGEDVVEYRIVGAGAAIGKCKQIARYVMRAIKEKNMDLYIRYAESDISIVPETVTDLLVFQTVEGDEEFESIPRDLATCNITMKFFLKSK